MIKLMHVQYPAVYNSCFWNFPETAWRMMNCRQATHPIFTCFLGSREEPPGGERCVARRRVTTNPDSGFCLNYLAVMNTRQATWTNFGSVLVF